MQARENNPSPQTLVEDSDIEWRDDESEFSEESEAEEFLIPKTKKKYLQEIQKEFSQPTLHDKSKNMFTLTYGFHLYSNDRFFIPDYFEIMDLATKSAASIPATSTKPFNLLNALHLKSRQHAIGIVIGNGYILSLLPEIRADDILLLDIEPVVHYFILQIKNLILNADTKKGFSILKKEMIKQIKLLEQQIYRHNPYVKQSIGIDMEMQHLGDKHFLSNILRFNECKNALEKELLPIKVNVFNKNLMEKLGIMLRKLSCKVSFLNLTNIGDYDKNHDLKSHLEKLPLTMDCKIILTLIKCKEKRGAYFCQTLDDVSKALDVSQHTKQVKKMGSGLTNGLYESFSFY